MRDDLSREVDRLGGCVSASGLPDSKGIRYTHVHAHLLRPDKLGRKLSAQMKLPYFITEHGIHSWSEKGLWKRPLVKAWYKSTLPEGTTIIAISPKVKRDLVDQGIDSSSIVVISNGIDTGEFTISSSQRPHRLNIALVGSLIARKKPLFAVNVFNEIYKQHNNARLLVAGVGPLQGKMESLVTKLQIDSRVEFIGHTNTRELFSDSDLLLHTADDEPFGLVVAEAMASGVPVIARAGGGADALLPPGPYCSAVDSNVPTIWAKSAAQVLEASAQDLDIAAMKLRGHVVSSFDVSKTSNQYLQLYQGVKA